MLQKIVDSLYHCTFSDNFPSYPVEKYILNKYSYFEHNFEHFLKWLIAVRTFIGSDYLQYKCFNQSDYLQYKI